VIIENRPGAGGQIGLGGDQSEPDGYTLLVQSSSRGEPGDLQEPVATR
jgi:tripartite-type tricarboxylate transporter receptor subunit TctC